MKNFIKIFTRKITQLIRNKKSNDLKSDYQEILSPIAHNTKESMDAFYSVDNFVEKYVDKSRDLFYQQTSDIVIKNLNGTESSICDVGCGQGDLLNYLSIKNKQMVCTYTGFDFSKKAVSIAKSRFSSIEFLEFDLTTDYKNCPNQFDTIICTEVLEHLLNPRKALDNLKCMAKKNATIILTVPEGRNDNFKGHINFWSPESWRQFINEEKSDFEFAETYVLPIDQYFFNVAVLKR